MDTAAFALARDNDSDLVFSINEPGAIARRARAGQGDLRHAVKRSGCADTLEANRAQG